MSATVTENVQRDRGWLGGSPPDPIGRAFNFLTRPVRDEFFYAHKGTRRVIYGCA